MIFLTVNLAIAKVREKGTRKKYANLFPSLSYFPLFNPHFSMIQLLPWYWKKLPLENRTGSEVFERLFYRKGTIGTLLESPASTHGDRSPLSRYSICAGSPRLIDGKPQLWTPQVGTILPFLRSLLQKKSPEYDSPALPFTGGWLGWLGYDLAWEIEKLPYLKNDSLPFPVAYWYEPESFAILDSWEDVLWLASSDRAECDRLQYKIESRKSKVESLSEV
nr:hypothetical protein [Hydrococcus sp. Prado102]